MFKNESKTKISGLEDFVNSKFPILSIYLGEAEIKSPNTSYFTSKLHSLVHQALGEAERKIFKKDLERIDAYINQSWDSRGKRSLVFFSSGKNLWAILDFEFYLSSLCVVSHSPYLQPIKDALLQYKPYLVILADRKRARLFTVQFGEIKQQTEVVDFQVPQRVKHGDDAWDSQGKIMRHIEDHLHRHLKLIAEAATEFVKNNPVAFVIVGGHKDMIFKVKKHLTYPLNKMVLGEFVSELNMPINKFFLESKKIARQINRRLK